jgi:hypothetical protein
MNARVNSANPPILKKGKLLLISHPKHPHNRVPFNIVSPQFKEYGTEVRVLEMNKFFYHQDLLDKDKYALSHFISFSYNPLL